MRSQLRDSLIARRSHISMNTPSSAFCRDEASLVRVFAIACIALLLSACTLSNQPPASPTPDRVLPQVEILFPANDANVIEGTDLTIDILATDSVDPGIARVELIVDEQLINERGPDVSVAVREFRVEMNWLAQGLGRHAVTVIAYRPDGTQSDPKTIVVNVLADQNAPATTPEQ